MVVDYVTGAELRETPEERFRQLFEHILVDDLGYPKDHIRIEVPIQRGSQRKAESADIVVFNSKQHSQDNIYIIVEIETPGKTYDNQALSYVTATTAPYCAWFSGFEPLSKGPFFLFRDLKLRPREFVDIPSLPRFGETEETIGKYRKEDLKPAKDLRILFTRIHYKLYGAGPIKEKKT